MFKSKWTLVVLVLLVFILIEFYNGVDARGGGRGGGGGRSGGGRSSGGRSGGGRSGGRGGGRSGGRGGGRGGGRSGGRGGGRSSPGRKATTAITKTAVRRYKGPTYRKTDWKTGVALRTVWGISSYKTRKLYLDDPEIEPTVCFNAVKPKNGSHAYFVCPEARQPDDWDYCCGEEGDEQCCIYTGDGEMDEATKVLIVLAAMIGPVLIFFCIFAICTNC